MKLRLAFMGLAASVCTAAAAHASTYDTAVEAPGPLAYYNMANANGSTTTDAVNGYTMSLNNGAAVVADAGPIVNGASVPGLVLANGAGGSQYAGSGGSSPEIGGINDAGTILAWINLAALPSDQGRIFSIAGSSAAGDDLDLQIDGGDNTVRFYTDGGSYTGSSSLTSADVGQWLFVAGTFTAGTDRQVYIDGALAGSSTPGGHYDSGQPFYIGQSNVFGGRYFDGSIADVAFYDKDLTAAQIGAIYAAAFAPSGVVSAAPEPSAWAFMFAGICGVGLLMRRERKTASPAVSSVAA